MSGTSTNQRLERLGRPSGRPIMQPADIYWCDGSADEYDRLCGDLVDSGTFVKLDETKRPEQLLGPLRPRRRRPCRGPHVHLLGDRGGGGAEQQLARARAR